MMVLIVEDDDQIRTLVGASLEPHDIAVTEAADVQEAQRALDGAAFDVVILDLTLPDGSGVDVLERIHIEFPQSHVIILSGASGELDRVRGLELGADDYVVKPFSARELAARVLAVRRRRAAPLATCVSFGRFELDLVARRLLRDGAPVELSTVEFAVLAFLAVRAGHVFSRTELIRVAHRASGAVESDATLRGHVRGVRAAIETDAHRPSLIRAVRGVGYRFDVPAGGRAGIADDLRYGPGTVVTVESRIVAADAAAAALLGVLEPSELHGAHVLDFVAPQSLRSALERIRALALAADARSQVFVVVHPDGTELPVQVTTSATVWEGEAAVELRLRPAAEESPRLRRLLTGVLGEVTDPVVITDADLHVRSWNRAAERLYGWSESEVLGRHLLDVVGSSAHESEWDAIRGDLEMGDQWHGEIHQMTRDGSIVGARASVTVARDDAGSIVGIVSVNRPITSQPVDARRSTYGADLHRGLAAGELEVYYQPVVDLRDSHVVTVEALVRWNHPEAGLLLPDMFIDSAERSGAIHELGTFVLSTACRQVALWRTSGTQIALAVNLSARELGEPDLVERITATAAASGLDLDVLWLEVTETALVEDVAQASRLLRELAALGVGISIDDFGTGWASLTYLRRFPVHALKIDRSFVTGVDQDPNSATIVRSIIALGAELDLVVVAEGIETLREADALVALGCTVGQGYLFGRPVPAADLDLTRMLPLRLPTPPRQEHLVTEAAPAPAALVSGADLTAAVLRRLLRIRSSAAAAELLQRAVLDLGGSLVLAAEAGDAALLIDVSLGDGPPLLPRAELRSAARRQIERILPQLAEDARQAVDLLHRQEHPPAQSKIDALTGLATRRVLERALSGTRAGVIVMLDLDHFEILVDTVGQVAADAVLGEFGAVLGRSARAHDACYRIGRQEFVIVVSDPDVPAAAYLIDQIRTEWNEVDAHASTFSAGVAPVDDGGGSALLAADGALSRAIALGRNRTELAISRSHEDSVHSVRVAHESRT